MTQSLTSLPEKLGKCFVGVCFCCWSPHSQYQEDGCCCGCQRCKPWGNPLFPITVFRSGEICPEFSFLACESGKGSAFQARMLSEKHRVSQTAELDHSDLEICASQNAKGSFGLGLNKKTENFNPRTVAHVWLSLNVKLGILMRSNFISLVFQGNFSEPSLCVSE